jgi:iron-sulfur cluster assembly protein
MEIVYLTEKAQNRAKTMWSEAEDPRDGLRIAIVGKGCSGFKYQLGWDHSREIDHVHEYSNGLKVIVDPQSALFLKRATMEYIESVTGSGFEITNPHDRGCCRHGGGSNSPEPDEGPCSSCDDDCDCETPE